MSTDLIKALFKGVVTVVFEKIDTKEIRTMPCTLNQELHKQHIDIKNIGAMDTIVCYALDKEAWRDVRVSTIKDWYEGYPKKHE
jgi:hypothetical protein|tara:strand:- start:475 stop:726 length:252 start_codon:yes stop_codon:yes gene_type:complete